MEDDDRRALQLASLCGELIERMLAIRGEGTIKAKSLLSNDLGHLLADLPDYSAKFYAARARSHLPPRFDCLDFGCGNAPHRRLLTEFGARWTGCYFSASVDPATLARGGSDFGGAVVEYGGTILPFADNTFEMIWCWQALEHVHNPEVTFAEIGRVLKPKGVFCGATSFLEPYHAQSTFSYTLFGFKLICERHGLQVIELAPSLDGLSYITKRLALMLGVVGEGAIAQKHLADCLPLSAIQRVLQLSGRGAEWVHLLAQICGTFRFTAVKG